MSTDRYFDIQLDSKRGRRMFVKLKHDERGTLMLGRVVNADGDPFLNENGKAELCMFLPACIHTECRLGSRGLEPLP